MNITIRKARPSDWQTIQRLNNEVFTDNAPYDPFLDLDYPKSLKGLTYYKKVIRTTDYCCLIAHCDGKPIGYLVGSEQKRPYRKLKIAEIDNMGVSPENRSQGVGKQLVEKFIKWAKGKGFTSIYVNSYCENEKAIKFYKSLGMKPIDLSLEMEI